MVLARLSLVGLRFLLWQAANIDGLLELENLCLEQVKLLPHRLEVGCGLLKLLLQMLDLIVSSLKFALKALYLLLLGPVLGLSEKQTAL